MVSSPALTVCCLHVLRMRRRVARTVSVAYERPELEAVVVRNFTPALPGLMQRDNVVETLASSVRQKMRFFQAAPAQTSRGSFRLQRRDGNSGCRRNSVHVCCPRRTRAEDQKEHRYCYA